MEERYYGGKLFCYIIRYVLLGGLNNIEMLFDVDEDIRRVNLVNLIEGLIYVFVIVGYISKGEGK